MAVVMRRQDVSIDFTNRDWVEYKDGLGFLDGEFWLGLSSMCCLTNQGNWELRIDYQLENGTTSYITIGPISINHIRDNPFDSGYSRKKGLFIFYYFFNSINEIFLLRCRQ